jgi:hypothetical protein
MVVRCAERCQSRRAGSRPVRKTSDRARRHGAPRQRLPRGRSAGRRDRVLILVGFAAALQPSELARLAVGSLTRHEDGIALFLSWRKNDQEAQGTTVWLPVGRTLYPVRGRDQQRTAVSPFVAVAAARAKGRPQNAARCRIGTNPIDTDSIALVIKKWTSVAGLDSTAFAGHSLRRGAISSGVAQGSISRGSSNSPAMPRSRASKSMLSLMSYATITR